MTSPSDHGILSPPLKKAPTESKNCPILASIEAILRFLIHAVFVFVSALLKAEWTCPPSSGEEKNIYSLKVEAINKTPIVLDLPTFML
ncbi:unnamed protein product [Microthlaspi erraticum]|uniref:Uncharacterized protein n=1 Tax=Microthlaspi erraticum TaxID=1685480 RepID=A0A6D2L6T8_9BRAS|nr:unnamed protein product [Microthlaspi erraticum]